MPEPAHPSRSHAPDALIVGGGVVGAAVAWFLAKAGVQVRVLEAGFPGGGTTAAGMGHIVVMDDSPAQLALTLRSRALLEGLEPFLDPRCELDPCGTLWVAEDQDQMEKVYEKWHLLNRLGVAAEVLDPQALAEAEPQLRPGLAGALRVPGDRVVYPPGFTRWLLDDAGVTVESGVEVQALRSRGVVLASGEVREAEIIVNAAGVRAPALTPGLPIVPRKGHLVITDRAPGFCRHQLVELGYLKSAHTMTAASVAFNVQPRRTGQLLIGSSRELVGWDPSLNREILGRMLARAFAFLPGLETLSAVRSWTGFRPAVEDKLPLVGRWTPLDGVWIAAGHEGLGITTALATGELLRDLILGTPPALDPAPFDPHRTPPEDHPT
jgi:glycine/D-amino acid oxidase-like deaminating enzyme